MLEYLEYEQKLLSLMRQLTTNYTVGALQNQRVVLGGVRGSGGGEGGPIQPFIGKLPQSDVTFDTDEFASVTIPSGNQASLLDNLNRIRYGLTIEPGYVPINYTVPSGLSSTLLDHLDGIDDALASGGGGGGHVIQDEGIDLPQRTNLNFVGASVTATDDIGNDATLVTIVASGGALVDHTHSAIDGGQLDWDIIWTDAAHDHSSAAEGGTLNLDNLADVDVPAPNDDDVLTWDSVAGEWTAAASGAGVQTWPGPDEIMIGTTLYATFALAVAAAVSGDLIKLGEGTFTCDNQTLPNGVDVVGSGLDVTYLETTAQVTTLTAQDGCHLQDLSVRCVGAFGAVTVYALVAGSASDVVYMINVVCYANNASGTATGAYGLYLPATNTVIGRDLWCDGVGGGGNRYGAYIDGSAYFRNSRFNGDTGSIYVNAAKTCRLETSCQLVTAPAGAGTLNGLFTDGSGDSFVINGAPGSQTQLPGGGGGWPFTGKVATVDTTDADADYATIALAIAGEADGDTLLLSSETFSEAALAVSKSLAIVGLARQRNIVQGSGSGSANSVIFPSGASKIIQLNNLFVKHNAAAINSNTAGLHSSNNNSLTFFADNCAFDATGAQAGQLGHGFRAASTSGTKTFTFNHCRFKSNGDAGAYGVQLIGTDTITVILQDCQIDDNVIVNNANATLVVRSGVITGTLTITAAASVTFHNVPTVVGAITGTPVGAYRNTSGSIVLVNPINEFSTDGTLAGNSDTAVPTEKAVLTALSTGWVIDTKTWTYASATTFTVSGDHTTQFKKGTKLKLTQTTVKYFYVVASSYSTPNTTVTITGGSDYSLANAAITSPYYSYQEAPQGFPTTFNYVPTFTGFSVAPTVLRANFSLHHGLCFMSVITNVVTGTSNATTFTVSLPITSSAVTGDVAKGSIQYMDNGSVGTGPGLASTDVGATVVILFKDWAGAAWTGSGNKGANFSFAYNI